jgi:hypothetical protein
MDAVALAATIGGSVVALAGVGATVWAAAMQRASAGELATAQREHERDLARGARLFDKRGAVYEAMNAYLLTWMQRVESTEKFWRSASEPEPPEPPSDDEWRAMQVSLRTFGSQAVADAYDELSQKITAFYAAANMLYDMREQGAVTLPHQEVEDARERVREAHRALVRLASSELATL